MQSVIPHCMQDGRGLQSTAESLHFWQHLKNLGWLYSPQEDHASSGLRLVNQEMHFRGKGWVGWSAVREIRDVPGKQVGLHPQQGKQIITRVRTNGHE